MTAALTSTAPAPDQAGMLAALKVLFDPADVVELRALYTKGRKRTAAGYFDAGHWPGLVASAAQMNAAGAAVYVTLNPVNPQLLGRYSNRVQDYADATATDADVTARRWMLVDIDPQRPKATSATAAQLEAADALARELYGHLQARGWPDPVVAESGNGMHLLYPLALPNDPESRDLVKGALAGLAARFDTDAVKVDQAVFNAGRITKLYGSTSNKGDHTDAAPWRLSRLVTTPARGATVTPEQLRAEHAQPDSAGAVRHHQRQHTAAARGAPFDLAGFLGRLSIAHEQDMHEGSERYKLAHCPFNPEHGKGEAAVFRRASGALAFKCLHNSCAGNDWRALRELVDGPQEAHNRPQADISGLLQQADRRGPAPAATEAAEPADLDRLASALDAIPKDAGVGRHSAAAVIGMALRHVDSGVPEDEGRALCQAWDARTGGASLAVFEESDPFYCATKPLTAASVYAMAHEAGWTPPLVWEKPQELLSRFESEPYPVDALPDVIRLAVEEVAGFVQAPLPMVASSALAALSLAGQGLSDVQRASKLQGPCGLFLLTIADSGERKSTCDGFFASAIRDHEAAAADAAKPAMKDYRADVEAWEAKRSGIKEKLRQDTKADKPTAGAEAMLRDLEHAKPEPPRVARMLYADVTPEALAYGLAKQWPSAGVVSAEAGVVFGSHGMGKDSGMRNLALLNQLWDGASLTIDRRTSESFTVRGARLTVALQVQEPTLREFFDKTGALARGTGFLARFLVAWPASTQGTRLFAEPPANWPALAVFHRRIAELLALPVPIDDDGALTPPVVPLTPEAKAEWVEFHDAIESELSAGGELHDVRDVASKTADNAARLAGLFQLFAGGGAIGAEAFECASRIVAWHLSEARRFFGELALPQELADAARLDAWLLDYCRRNDTRTTGKNHVRKFGPLRDGARLDAAIGELAALDRLAVRKTGKRIDILLNPALPLSEGAA